MPTANPDWKMPEKPIETCVTCGGSDIYPQAECEDGWELYWGCDLCGDATDGTIGEMETVMIPWPFGDDERATADDLRALGFSIF